MRRRVVTVVGAGSLRCAPPVLASIAAPRFEHPLEVRLFDANLERLDLMGRLLARLFEVTRAIHVFAMHPNLGLALLGADAVIVTLHEDCARRMTGPTAARVLLTEEQTETGHFSDLSRGDLNKPTPAEKLSPMTLAALTTPVHEGRSRDEAVLNALALTVERLDPHSLILNLTRNAPLSPAIPHTALDWPPQLSPHDLSSIPHRVLRWIDGDHGLEAYMEQHRNSPVARWLIDELGAL